MGTWFNEGLRQTAEMRVFVSHRQSDEPLAVRVMDRLARKQVPVYLDTFDPVVGRTGDELGDYLRTVMGMCTHLMAVLSDNTTGSWWVPWEIGVATEKEFPLSTYAGDGFAVPEFLKKWPYLTRLDQIDTWVDASRRARRVVGPRFIVEGAPGERTRATREFYREVRSALGQ